jgi:metallophosphoesterase superfamily enzyme
VQVFPDGVEIGGWQVVHGHQARLRGWILQGHLHPSLKWRRGMSGPCFLIGPRRIILPAFSRDVAGINVLKGRSWTGYRCAVIVGHQVLDFGSVGELRKRWHAEKMKLRV